MEIIIDYTKKKLNRQINESLENYDILKEEALKPKLGNNNNDSNDNEENDEESDEKTDEESDEESDGNNNEEFDKNENIIIPNWYNIKEISDETITEIKNLFKKESLNFKNMKDLIKNITKLALTYERIKIFKFSIKDCYDFINFNFNGEYKLYKDFQDIILKDSLQKKK